MTPCPDPARLAELAIGALSASQRSELELHFDECATCRRTLAAVVARTEDGAARSDDAAIAHGTRIGRYVVNDVIGMGGMGVVLSATDPDLSRTVALKLLRPSLDPTGDVSAHRERILREGQAMARLSSPNLVGIYDVGTWGDCVFLALEHVDGVTLRRWLAQQPRPWREVLGVLRQAGRGLAAAHDAGLVHRDFKPDNVLIAANGRVAVADFGLASIAGGARADVAAGTPAYMAPEQRRGEADARADQYAYCLTLYEALTGALPTAEPSAAALARRGVPRWVARACLTGLAEDPQARHASMAALLTALAPPAWQRPAVAVAALSLLVGVLGGAALRSAQPTCAEAGAKIGDAWGDGPRAGVQAAFRGTGPGGAAHFSRVAAPLDAYAKGWAVARVEICEAARRGDQSPELTDLRVACLERRRGELRALVGVLAAADAAVVDRAAEAVSRLSRLDDCADASALTQAPRPPAGAAAQIAALRDRLAQLKAHTDTGQGEPALALAEPLERDARLLDWAPLHAEALYQLGIAQQSAARWPAAEATLQSALARAGGAQQDALAAECAIELMSNLGYAQARYAEALALGSAAEAMVGRAGWPPVVTARLYNTLGILADEQGRYDDAARHYAKALALRRQVFGEKGLPVAHVLTNLGDSQRLHGLRDEAAQTLGEALAIKEPLLGPDHIDVAATLINLGVVELERGATARARAAFTRAGKILGARPGIAAASTSIVDDNLAAVALAEGDAALALAHADRSLQAYAQLQRPEVPTVASTFETRCLALLQLGRATEAREACARAVKIFESTSGPEHRHTAVARSSLALVEESLGHPQQAEALHRRSLLSLGLSLGPHAVDTARVAFRVGELARRRGELPEAQRSLERASTDLAEALGAGHPTALSAAASLAELYLQLGDRALAETTARAAMEHATADETPKAVRARLEAVVCRSVRGASATNVECAP